MHVPLWRRKEYVFVRMPYTKTNARDNESRDKVGWFWRNWLIVTSPKIFLMPRLDKSINRQIMIALIFIDVSI